MFAWDGVVGPPTISETVTVAVDLPGPVTMTCPVWVAAVRPTIDGVTCIVSGPVPVRGETVSQGWSLRAMKANVSPPDFVTWTLTGVGLVDPCLAEAVMVAGLRVSDESGFLTVISEYALSLLSALLVAVTLKVISAVAGRVLNNPFALIVPNVVDHVTAVFALLVTVAVNC